MPWKSYLYMNEPALSHFLGPLIIGGALYTLPGKTSYRTAKSILFIDYNDHHMHVLPNPYTLEYKCCLCLGYNEENSLDWVLSCDLLFG